MKITDHSLTSIDIRLTERVTTSAGELGDRSGVRLVLRTDVGLSGQGETAPIPGLPTSGSLEEIASQIADWSTAANDADADEALAALDEHSMLPAARFAVHTALVDLLSQRAEVPLHQWLRSGSEPSVVVNALVSAETPKEVHGEVSAAMAAGFPAVKLKVGAVDLARDATRIIAASEAAGPNAELRLDANRAWTTADVEHVIGRVGRHRLSYIEDPTADTTEYADLADRTGVTMAIDAPPEAGANLAGLVEDTGIRALVVKPAAAGGVDRILDVARVVGESCQVIVTSSIDSEIALLAALHVAAALPVPPRTAHGLSTAGLVQGVSDGLNPVAGKVGLGAGSGLGTPAEIG
ncbi:MAG: mandelate racemase/muconate lactonizing enzyme family protein [Acidimicrobiales bacterium]